LVRERPRVQSSPAAPAKSKQFQCLRETDGNHVLCSNTEQTEKSAPKTAQIPAKLGKSVHGSSAKKVHPRKLDLTAERLREVLHYDPETGVFRWRVRANSRADAGTVAGRISKNHGYRKIGIDRRYYQASRLAWLYVTGEFPTLDIDHCNLQKSDDRFCNLRQATDSQNQANTRAQANSTTGVKGICWARHAHAWNARICVNGRRIFLGYFDTKEIAAAAYCAAAVKYHGEFARTS
jgi:hypothetical protein